MANARSEVALIVNGGARRGEELFQSAKRLIEASQFRLVSAKLSKRGTDFSAAVADAATQGIPVVLVGGGDGSLSLIVKHFVSSSSVLGVLPLGTGNAFARDLGIPTDVQAACSVALEGSPAKIDLGYANGDYFVNIATVGLTAQIVRELDPAVKHRFGRAAYLVALARALRRVRPFRATLTVDGNEIEFDSLQVVIGNGRFHAGPFPIAPDASLLDGRLSIYGLATTNRAALFKLGWHLVGGRHGELPEVHAVSAVSGTLQTSPIQRAIVDGEANFRTPLGFRSAPKAIEVMVPESFGSTA